MEKCITQLSLIQPGHFPFIFSMAKSMAPLSTPFPIQLKALVSFPSVDVSKETERKKKTCYIQRHYIPRLMRIQQVHPFPSKGKFAKKVLPGSQYKRQDIVSFLPSENDLVAPTSKHHSPLITHRVKMCLDTFCLAHMPWDQFPY